MPKRPRSDETHKRHKHPALNEDDEMLDIRSQLDMLHKISSKLSEEKKRNRIIVALIGMLVLVAEVANIITKLVLK